ncbi:MAG: hypothetical protein KGN00_03235 [Chloroflexota bacterium]|nr:hypothetical protein [Chloroflexota bacterium]MDE3192680.1 hypothetical protein [Chloroflexota bacterium]
MAGALRPAVILIALASILFLLAGGLDAWHGAPDYASIESYLFGVVNLVVAVAIARGNERILALRMGLAAFFVVERPVTALVFPTPLDAAAVHVVTAVVELVILLSTLRIWHLGHSIGDAELSMLSLTAEPAAPIPAAAEPRRVKNKKQKKK